MYLLDILQYGFIQRAFFAGSFVGVACACLGVFLVLRKMSLIGDGLSHVSFGAIALGMLLGIYPFAFAIPFVCIAAIGVYKLSQTTKIHADAAIGIVSAVGIAAGVVLASVSGGFNVDLFSYLFGNILAVSSTEVAISVALSCAVIVSIGLLYWDLYSVTFDEEYAKTSGIKTERVGTVLTILTAITVVVSVKVVGVMLVSALLILPAVSALQLAKSLKGTLVLSTCISVFSIIAGIVISFLFDVPAGATIVLLSAFIFACSFLMRRLQIA